MLNENNLSFFGNVDTGINHVLTDDGELAYMYDVSLTDVERLIIEWENQIFSLS